MTSRRAKRLLPLIVLLFVYSLSHTPAQQNTQQNSGSRVFNISVVDEGGKPYAALKPEDFAAWVNDSPRKVLSLSAESAPVSVGLLIDKSNIDSPSKQTTSPGPRSGTSSN